MLVCPHCAREQGVYSSHSGAAHRPALENTCSIPSRQSVRLSPPTYRSTCKNGSIPRISSRRTQAPVRKGCQTKLYRMRTNIPGHVVAKSRFWYYLRQLRNAKKASGEIVGLNVIHEKKPLKVKNFGIWLRYDSRSGTHNMYKEFRELSRVDAAQACYQDMASRHRARFRSIQILRIAEIEKASDVRRPNIKQLLVPKLRFPLPHRVVKYRSKFLATRPSTFY
ncbi:60S ribosomal protein L20 [Puccinia graminis f. sp. tritici CRL 75-36-700-3]|uniref:Large subunit ribosomal protein L18Ae n=2 Tax=Puccinia graminis f. sp. tritici (strain CRL 75-36-700-3 / race SCCL) TaxID=418459 RepID=E3KMY4_PUCGT|nr:60S ribosomal protein L20 [Puccinia graminis f. sp. tritici CRL 75-36-700-3]EFP85620.1 large subunit ribosomal protein L18Ae [Puccinia graminis f. sp. tritici CRL 75-36-700-3]